MIRGKPNGHTNSWSPILINSKDSLNLVPMTKFHIATTCGTVANGDHNGSIWSPIARRGGLSVGAHRCTAISISSCRSQRY